MNVSWTSWLLTHLSHEHCYFVHSVSTLDIMYQTLTIASYTGLHSSTSGLTFSIWNGMDSRLSTRVAYLAYSAHDATCIGRHGNTTSTTHNDVITCGHSWNAPHPLWSWSYEPAITTRGLVQRGQQNYYKQFGIYNWICRLPNWPTTSLTSSLTH